MDLVRYLNRIDAPLCACGCGKQVTWDKRHKRWYKYFPDHCTNYNKIVEKGDAPLCACGCGEYVTWSKYHKRKWNMYLPDHILNVFHEKDRVGMNDRKMLAGDVPLCACGCGEHVTWRERYQRWNRFLPNHHIFSAKYRKEVSNRTKALWNTPEYRNKVTKKLKSLWDNPDVKFLERCFKIQNVCPNKPEQIINSLTPDIVEFVGNRKWWRTLKIKGENGEEIIKHKNPDFIIKGQHKVIELNGAYWHRNDDIQKWYEAWEKIGYKLLVIWERDIYENLEDTLNKIGVFIEQNE
jgi:hypothetical protein